GAALKNIGFAASISRTLRAALMANLPRKGQTGGQSDLASIAKNIGQLPVDPKVLNQFDGKQPPVSGLPEQGGPPALRSAGICLIKHGRLQSLGEHLGDAVKLNNRIAGTSAQNAGAPPGGQLAQQLGAHIADIAGADTDLYAEDLLRGYRVDVLDEA